eukprot:NODE_7182_length_288_cov_311.292887_g6022_i0.p2 GENE.NODE_7182_length_288_cov_311.292887_g6022_i0~~NODE_7182_length_288_cov_311.292887_g6022_i0.p2  ORF type:complete len:67 (+),score=20.27 NODE_7182_length_288_cov_311.292887_g6022_i0:72-272(+)
MYGTTLSTTTVYTLPYAVLHTALPLCCAVDDRNQAEGGHAHQEWTGRGACVTCENRSYYPCPCTLR